MDSTLINILMISSSSAFGHIKHKAEYAEEGLLSISDRGSTGTLSSTLKPFLSLRNRFYALRISHLTALRKISRAVLSGNNYC
jgi:hypothetical protein